MQNVTGDEVVGVLGEFVSGEGARPPLERRRSYEQQGDAAVKVFSARPGRT